MWRLAFDDERTPGPGKFGHESVPFAKITAELMGIKTHNLLDINLSKQPIAPDRILADGVPSYCTAAIAGRRVRHSGDKIN